MIMLDDFLLKKLTEFYQGLLNLLEAQPIPIEELYRELSVDNPASSEQVLRELNSDEADLFFLDFLVFKASRTQRHQLEAGWSAPNRHPPGLTWLMLLEPYMGLAGKLLIVSAGIEFVHDARMSQWKKSGVRIEIVNDALSFVVFPGDVVEEILPRNLFDLDRWIPDETKAQ
jgi:hypothetical protein